MSKVLVYTTKYCPYCHRAKALLDSKGISYEEIAADNSPEIRQQISELSGQYTVPQIFIDDLSIGGCDELYALNYNGKLDELLSSASTNSAT